MRRAARKAKPLHMKSFWLLSGAEAISHPAKVDRTPASR
jgi:hypothetical protein